MRFNDSLFAAIEQKQEASVIQEFQPLVKKLSASKDYAFHEDVRQELDIEVLQIIRGSDKKLTTDFYSYLNRLEILIAS